ncbi:putative transcriptional regulator (zinc finger domain) [Aliarcobacter cibarius]|uniref:TFIIB-type zinc ribbon-containing protein n=1 Tax=Aliarcobacter cibarius TaxID=255507 RepID=UPI00124428D5|nr:zf-TFIIB domain-containing protein [Aliarcobacter cibarius]QEZ89131.1 putative transcriptional regulator (zinc finger domain) [Aliarcobacter cibarius]
MKCPVCKDVGLLMSERQGVEIDYCPSCRGVWLDRGELDKIIEKNSNYQPSNQPSNQQSNNHSNYFKNDNRNSYNKHNNHQQYNSYDNKHQTPYKKKKEGFLSEIFDFDF